MFILISTFLFSQRWRHSFGGGQYGTNSLQFWKLRRIQFGRAAIYGASFLPSHWKFTARWSLQELGIELSRGSYFPRRRRQQWQVDLSSSLSWSSSSLPFGPQQVVLHSRSSCQPVTHLVGLYGKARKSHLSGIHFK